MFEAFKKGVSKFSDDFAPRRQPVKSPAEVAARSAAIKAAQNIEKDFKTMKEAYQVLWVCRNDVENYLNCKRLSVGVSLFGRVLKRVMMSGAAFAGGAVCAPLPVVGPTLGGVLGANAVDTLVQDYHLIPQTDLVELIEKATKGLFGRYLSPAYYQEEAEGYYQNDMGNRLINRGLEFIGVDALPVGVPVVWTIITAEQFIEVYNTSKLDLAQRLKINLRPAESMLNALDSRFRAEFLSHKRNAGSAWITPKSARNDGGYAVQVTKDSWVWEGVYLKYKKKVDEELKKLHELVLVTERKYAMPQRGPSSIPMFPGDIRPSNQSLAGDSRQFFPFLNPLSQHI